MITSVVLAASRPEFLKKKNESTKCIISWRVTTAARSNEANCQALIFVTLSEIAHAGSKDRAPHQLVCIIGKLATLT